ncbi:non-specific lipid-transfer protein 1-like [Oryza brachyantha]|uniref:non-specific lipid-transfer protein 1-like n=1 Tax=Oryza brachyantha TaxID=4533 RepID=UPI001ADB178A|nr:non-specific lipid-transfer protein 1-like [Oryza brachyantha]
MAATAAGWSLAATATVVAVVVVACCAATAAASSSPSSQLDCGTVTSLLSGCAAFVRHGAGQLPPAPGTPCCDGVAGLYAVAADSSDNWRAVCRCTARLVRRRHGPSASAIALLPGLCGVVGLRLGADAHNIISYCRSFS